MEIILGLLILVALATASKHGQAHPTGDLPEPEPQPQPHYEPPAPAPSVTPHGGGPGPAPAPSPAPKPYPVPSHPAAHPPAHAALPAKAPVVPVSWPQAVPKELPAWPAGWEPDTPVPAAEVARAKVLLPTLWKSGKPGQRKTEQTAGKWVTYLAFVPSKGKRGVAAFRVKPGAQGGQGGTVTT
jgi:hypothetical protein